VRSPLCVRGGGTAEKCRRAAPEAAGPRSW